MLIADDLVAGAVDQQHGHRADGAHHIHQVEAVRHAPAERPLQRPGEPAARRHLARDPVVTREAGVQHHGPECRAHRRLRTYQVAAQRSAEALAQQVQRQAPRGILGLDPIQCRANILEHRRYLRHPGRAAEAAIVQQQHLVAGGRQPVHAGEMGADVLRIAMQEQHRAPGLALRRQPPGVEPRAIGRAQFQVAVLQAHVGRCADHARRRVEQQAAAARQRNHEQGHAGQCR